MKSVSPWGPLIYQNEISEEFHTFLLDGLKKSRRYGDNYKNKLVGQINCQRGALYDNDELKGFLNEHIGSFSIRNLKRTQEQSSYHEPTAKSKDFNDRKLLIERFEKDPKSLNLDYELPEPWINFQKPNEYNPIHEHTGVVSAIIFIDIPEEIKNERDTSQFDHKTNGCLEFLYDCSTSFVVTPHNKMIFLFPASLKHTVYPYQSDVERITMSFNLIDKPKFIIER